MNGRGPIFGTRLNGFHLLGTTPAPRTNQDIECSLGTCEFQGQPKLFIRLTDNRARQTIQCLLGNDDAYSAAHVLLQLAAKQWPSPPVVPDLDEVEFTFETTDGESLYGLDTNLVAVLEVTSEGQALKAWDEASSQAFDSGWPSYRVEHHDIRFFPCPPAGTKITIRFTRSRP